MLILLFISPLIGFYLRAGFKFANECRFSARTAQTQCYGFVQPLWSTDAHFQIRCIQFMPKIASFKCVVPVFLAVSRSFSARHSNEPVSPTMPTSSLRLLVHFPRTISAFAKAILYGNGNPNGAVALIKVVLVWNHLARGFACTHA